MSQSSEVAGVRQLGERLPVAPVEGVGSVDDELADAVGSQPGSHPFHCLPGGGSLAMHIWLLAKREEDVPGGSGQ